MHQIQRFQLGAAFPGKVQQVADNFFGAPGFVDHIADHFFTFRITEGVIVFKKHVGREGNVVQRIIQLVGHPGRKGSHRPHFVGLDEHGLAVFQILDHTVERHGQFGEFIAVEAGRHDGGEVPRGDALGVI